VGGIVVKRFSRSLKNVRIESLTWNTDRVSSDDTMKLTRKHQQLQRVFKEPVAYDIPWNDIEKILIALGGI
jgi:hypothetical protein